MNINIQLIGTVGTKKINLNLKGSVENIFATLSKAVTKPVPVPVTKPKPTPKAKACCEKWSPNSSYRASNPCGCLPKPVPKPKPKPVATHPGQPCTPVQVKVPINAPRVRLFEIAKKAGVQAGVLSKMMGKHHLCFSTSEEAEPFLATLSKPKPVPKPVSKATPKAPAPAKATPKAPARPKAKAVPKTLTETLITALKSSDQQAVRAWARIARKDVCGALSAIDIAYDAGAWSASKLQLLTIVEASLMRLLDAETMPA